MVILKRCEKHSSRAAMYGISPKAAIIVEIEGLYDFVSANNPPANRGSRTSAPELLFSIPVMLPL